MESGARCRSRAAASTHARWRRARRGLFFYPIPLGFPPKKQPWEQSLVPAEARGGRRGSPSQARLQQRRPHRAHILTRQVLRRTVPTRRALGSRARRMPPVPVPVPVPQPWRCRRCGPSPAPPGSAGVRRASPGRGTKAGSVPGLLEREGSGMSPPQDAFQSRWRLFLRKRRRGKRRAEKERGCARPGCCWPHGMGAVGLLLASGAANIQG